MKTKSDGIGFDFCVFTDYDSNAEVRLYEIGNYACVPDYSYGPIIRPRGIIHYVISGKGVLIINDQKFDVHENQIFYIPPDVSAYYKADHNDPWSYKWFHIGGTAFHSVLKEVGLDMHKPVLDITSNKSEAGTFVNLVKDIFAHYEKEYYCIGKVYELLDYLKSEYGHQSEDSYENLQLKYVRTVIKYIQLKYSEQIHMEEIAGTCGLNRSYLSRLFHDATGYTIKGYLLSYRMKKAQSMLKNSEYTVQHVGAAVGYTDIYTFSKAFKKFTGQTPSEYRNQAQPFTHGTTS